MAWTASRTIVPLSHEPTRLKLENVPGGRDMQMNGVDGSTSDDVWDPSPSARHDVVLDNVCGCRMGVIIGKVYDP